MILPFVLATILATKTHKPVPLDTGTFIQIPVIVVPQPIAKPSFTLEPTVEPLPVAAPVTPAPTVATGGDSYTAGNCTWFVASRVNVPQNLGNANTWAVRASAEGFTVSPIPRTGSVGQTTAGSLGHVVYVEQVSGGQVYISEMNASAGLGNVDYRWAPIGDFVYIYF